MQILALGVYHGLCYLFLMISLHGWIYADGTAAGWAELFGGGGQCDTAPRYVIIALALRTPCSSSFCLGDA